MTEGSPQQSESPGVLSNRGNFQPLWFAAKLAISLGLIVVVFWKLDLAAVWGKLRQLSGALILTVILMFAVQTYVAAWRWWVILRHHRLEIRLVTAVRISLIGAFFNQILPSSIGGDVARAWCVYRDGCSKRISVITVLSDRIYGMLTLTCLAVACFPLLVHFSVRDEALIGVGALIIAAASALILAFWLDRLPGWTQDWAFIRHLGALSQSTRAITANRQAIAPLLGLSFCIHAITILAIVVLLAGMLPHLNLLLCAALVPAIMLMAMVPVSIAGWGVREGVMIYGLGLANVPPEGALIVSIMVGLSLVVVGLLGGLVWLVRPNRQQPRPLAF